MTKIASIVQKPNTLLIKICLIILFFFSLAIPVQAQLANAFVPLADGPLSAELWESVSGDLSDWQVIGGELQGQLLPPPVVSNYVSAVSIKKEFWPISSNYQLSFDFTPLDLADKNFAVLFDYRINSRGKALLTALSFHFTNQRFYAEKLVDGLVSHRSLLLYSLNPLQTYHFQLIYQKPDFELYIDEQLFFSSKNDLGFWPDFPEPGRPLFYLTKGSYEQSAAIYANFNLNYFPQLNVPYFSQSDATWATVIYDHAQEFFDPALTIASSGCALTSAAMLLNYYDYKNFPDQADWPADLRGKSINPETLNLWLKREADGYLGAALVNWLAITRLTATLAALSPDEHKTLEFSYAPYQAMTISEQLTAKQPVIADLDGHFVLITGINDNEENWDGTINNYLINDPADTRKNIDHEQQPIKSLRLFKASHTDLSYFLLISPEELNPKLLLENKAEELEPVISRENNLLNSQQDWYEYYWPKPENGNYLWQFSPSDLSKLALAQLFIYQKNGQVQIFNLADYLARELKLSYQKEQLSILSINNTAQPLLHYHQYLLNYLLQLQTEQYLLGNPQNALRYQNLIEQFLNFYQL